MCLIRSTKHRVISSASIRQSAVATLLALGMPTSLVMADEVTLPGVDVSAESIEPSYKVDRVSSPKFTQPLIDTPQTITVIDDKLMKEQGANTLTEALRNTPGVATFFLGENGNTTTGDAIYMRGYDASSSIYVDGVRDLGAISRDMFNIQQVEVTKGPAGTDTGGTSPTGGINLITKRAQLDPVTEGSVEVGSDYKRATADFNRAIEGVQGGAVRLNVMGQNAGVPGRDSVENDRWGLASSIALGLGTSTRAWLDLSYIKQNNVPDGGVPTIGLPGYTSPDPKRPYLGSANPVDPSNFYGTSSDYQTVTSKMATFTVEHDFSSVTKLRNTSRWGATQNNYLLTSFMGSSANWLTQNPANPSTWTIARNQPTFLNQENNITTNQTNISTQLLTGSVKHDLSMGVEFTQEKQINLTYKKIGSWPAANIYAPNPNVNGLDWALNGGNNNGETNTASVYAFDTLKLSEKWQLSGGLRFDHYRTDYLSILSCAATATNSAPKCSPGYSIETLQTATDLSTSGNLFSWKFGALYKITPDSSLYVNYATSQLPPGGANFQLSNAVNTANNPIFDPQTSKTIELGTKWDLIDGALGLTGALYRTDIENGVVQDPVSLQYYQTGKQRVQGLELSAIGQVNKDWNVSAGFTVMDTKVLSGPPVGNNAGRDDLNYTPRTAFTSWATYNVTPKFTLGGGARYVGSLQRGKDGAIGTPQNTDSYWVFDSMASYAVTKNVALQLNLYNLFNKEYVAAINKSGYRYTPGMPRTVRLTANLKF